MDAQSAKPARLAVLQAKAAEAFAGVAAKLPKFPAPIDTGEIDDPWGDIKRGGLVAGAFFIGLVGWAAFTPLDAGVVASGTVVVSGNRQAVQHLDGGIVRALHVKEGDQVKEGQILLELVDTELFSQERALSSRLIELEAQRARLDAEDAGSVQIAKPVRWTTMTPPDQEMAASVMARQQDELRARGGATSALVSILQRQQHELRARLPGQEEERASIEKQVDLLDDEINNLSGLLQKGLTPVGRVRALERERANLQGRSGRIISEIAQTNESISENQGQVASLSAELRAKRAEEKRDVNTLLSDVEPKFNAVQTQLERTRIRAPATGQVVALTAFTVGGVIQPGARVMDIVPSGRKLVIEADVRPENADEIHVDALARIRFPGVKGRDIPEMDGKVTKVSADRIVEPQTGRAFFRAEIEADAGQIEKLANTAEGKTSQIRPGIPAEVIIPLRKRTALQYFYEPLMGALWKSFHEE